MSKYLEHRNHPLVGCHFQMDAPEGSSSGRIRAVIPHPTGDLALVEYFMADTELGLIRIADMALDIANLGGHQPWLLFESEESCQEHRKPR